MLAIGMKVPTLLALTFVLFAYINQAEAIHCYNCNSNSNASCSDVKLLDNFKVNCDIMQKLSNLTRPYTMCRKMRITIDYSMNKLPPTDRVVRTCGWEDTNYNGTCYRRSAAGEKQMVCSCFTDYCNAASSNSPFITVFSIIFAIISIKSMF